MEDPRERDATSSRIRRSSASSFVSGWRAKGSRPAPLRARARRERARGRLRERGGRDATGRRARRSGRAHAARRCSHPPRGRSSHLAAMMGGAPAAADPVRRHRDRQHRRFKQARAAPWWHPIPGAEERSRASTRARSTSGRAPPPARADPPQLRRPARARALLSGPREIAPSTPARGRSCSPAASWRRASRDRSPASPAKTKSPTTCWRVRRISTSSPQVEHVHSRPWAAS